MLKPFIEFYIRKFKNPHFTLDKNLSGIDIASFLADYFFDFIRSWRLLFYGRIPSFLFIGKGVKLNHIHNIKFGKGVIISDFARISALGNEQICIGDSVRIGSFSQLVTSMTLNNIGKGIVLESNVSLGEFCYLGGAGGLVIKKGTIIGQYLSCHPENHITTDRNMPIRLQGVSRKGIIIGENCWIGSKVTILDGVHIGDNSICAAGAVINKSFPEYSIIGGVPAKLISTRK